MYLRITYCNPDITCWPLTRYRSFSLPDIFHHYISRTDAAFAVSCLEGVSLYVWIHNIAVIVAYHGLLLGSQLMACSRRPAAGSQLLSELQTREAFILDCRSKTNLLRRPASCYVVYVERRLVDNYCSNYS